MLAALIIATTTAYGMSTSALPRIEYVHAELQKVMVPYEYTLQLFVDPRTKLFPPPKPMIAEKNKSINWNKITAALTARASLKRGSDFVAEHLATLERTEAQYGVPKQTIAAVIGIESDFGAYTGATVAFNLFLSSMLHAAESRWRPNADNLVSLVTHCYATKQDCLNVKGSYAGALGLPQFLPKSMEMWGKDGNGDGIVNLFEPDDAIVSTANFLTAHGFDANPSRALARYYGSNVGYPFATITYAKAIKRTYAARAVLPPQN